MERFQKKGIIRDLKKKIVLLAGPRQAGKTTLAKEIAKEFSSFVYLNYDSAADRKTIHEESWLPTTELIIFDEIHKMKNWKNYLKGVFDTKSPHQKILVTGSARLEIFKKAGDSLAGRYFLHRLLPFSPAELKKIRKKPDLNRLIERGGFPEPFLAKTVADAKRWRLQYTDTLLRIDVMDFDTIQNINAIRLVFDILRERVGSPISYKSIAEDIQISPHTVKKYIDILEALYIVFRITPFSKNIARSILKEPKIYFFDNGLVKGDEGAKFENMVALCLLKHTFYKVDSLGEEYSLHYLRTKEKIEVDFALVKESQIERIIEVKLSDPVPAKGLYYFQHKYDLPAIQVVKEVKREKKEKEIAIQAALSFLEGLE